MPLGQVLRSLEDSGEVNLGVAEHDTSKSDNELGFQVRHDVCFVLDPLSTKKRKKARWSSLKQSQYVPNRVGGLSETLLIRAWPHC